MNVNTKRRQSFYENVEQITEKSTRRRSIFDNSNETSYEKGNVESLLGEWDQLWGQHKTDYVNVVNIPENYAENTKEEIKLWIAGLKEMLEKAGKLGNLSECIEIIEECELTSDQNVFLQDLDSKISQFMENAKTLMKTIETLKHVQELKLEEIIEEISFGVELVLFKKNHLHDAAN